MVNIFCEYEKRLQRSLCRVFHLFWSATKQNRAKPSCQEYFSKMAATVIDPSTAEGSAEHSCPEDPPSYPKRRSLTTHHTKDSADDTHDDGCFDCEYSRDEMQKSPLLPTESPDTLVSVNKELPKSIKLIIGAGGIYTAYLYHGSLQEDVFEFVDDHGQKFEQAWFLETLESFAILLFGFVGLLFYGEFKNLPYKMFWLAGSAQVCAKVCSNIALAAGLSYHIVVLGKSCKMLPVMVGSLLMGGVSYKWRQYAQAATIMAGTCLCLLSKGKPHNLEEENSSQSGVVYIALSLVFDGLVAGFQKRLQSNAETKGVNLSTCDFMFWMSLPMVVISGVVAMLNGEFHSGLAFCVANPILQGKVIRFSIMSAFGQVAVFYVISQFSPLVVTTVTTTRKIFSVLLSLTLKGMILVNDLFGTSQVATTNY